MEPETKPTISDTNADERGPSVITDVLMQRKRAQRRSIFIDGEFAFGISEESYVRFALFKGREVTPGFIAQVQEFEQLYQARMIAMRFIARRMRSVHEIRKKLTEREFAPEVIAATLSFLEGYGMVDDEAFARAFVHDQLLRRPLGRRRIEQELRRKGIDKESVEQTVGNVVDEASELRNALAAAQKKITTLRHDDPRKRERSLANFLAGRGFSWKAVIEVLATLRPQLHASATVSQNDNDDDDE